MAKLFRPKDGLLQIETGSILPAADQPRSGFSKAALEELAESIKIHGILQPLLVMREGDHYRLIAGERRLRAAKLAGLPGAVITRAREILAELEQENGVVHAYAPAAEPDDQISMLDLSGQQIRAALESISVETLTPIEAMNELYKLKKMLN